MRSSWLLACHSVGAAYDEARDVIVMYGGNGAPCGGDCDETWELVPD